MKFIEHNNEYTRIDDNLIYFDVKETIEFPDAIKTRLFSELEKDIYRVRRESEIYEAYNKQLARDMRIPLDKLNDKLKEIQQDYIEHYATKGYVVTLHFSPRKNESVTYTKSYNFSYKTHGDNFSKEKDWFVVFLLDNSPLYVYVKN